MGNTLIQEITQYLEVFMIDDTIKKDTTSNAEITDVSLGYVEKKKFRIEGDSKRILELNVSDLNIVARLKVGYPKLNELFADAQKKIAEIPEELKGEELLSDLADRLTAIDKDMRDTIDFIFDTNASEICAPSGNMYDPVGGQLRYMKILDTLTGLYTNGLHAEFDKLKNRVERRASKYTKKKK